MAGGDPAPPPQPMGLGTHLQAGRAAGGAGAHPGMLSPLPIPICPTSIPCNPCPLLPWGPYPGPRRVVAALGGGGIDREHWNRAARLSLSRCRLPRRSAGRPVW